MHHILKYSLPFIVILFFTQTGKAQLCTGSLGDPVVNITFGTGANPGPALPTSTTTYNYVSTTCPNDGFYTIASSSIGCFSDSWHSLQEDHTPGDANGYMMLVNASVNPGVFYLDTVKNLCGGTTYEFSAWLLSILKSSACMGNGNRPDITFSIETTTGTVIKTYATGSIPNLSSPQWNQYGFFFTLPAVYSDLVLRMTNSAPGGCGNDIALDDITFRPCGPKVEAVFGNITSATDTVYYCFNENKSITINGAIQSGYTNPAFQWQQSLDSGKTWIDIAGATGSSYTSNFAATGKFQYRMAAAEAATIGTTRCRVYSKPLTINIDGIPVPAAASNSPVCANTPITFNASNGYLYQWTGPNTFSSALSAPVITSATLNNAGKYYVLATTRGGCSKLDSTIVVVNNLPAANAGRDTIVCEGNSTSLQASGGVSYSWNAALSLSDISIANPVATPLITTNYIVTVTNQFSCTARDSVVVTVLKKPVANAGPDKKMIQGQTILLNGTAGGDTSSYFWTPAQFINNPNTLTPLVNPSVDITYTLHVLSGNGCGSATDEVFVRVFEKVVIPNIFSPNGDGVNDVWNIDALESYAESVTNVFNRYGQLVFRSVGYKRAWDGRYNGKPLSPGTYYYTIDRKDNFPLLSGSLTIIR